MEISQAGAIAAASLPILAPYAVKMAEGVATEIGKAIGKDVVKKVYELYQTIRDKILRDNDSQAEATLKDTIQSPEATSRLELIIVQKAATDSEFSSALVKLATDIRNLLLDCLKERFTMPELREIYTRLHVGFDDLIGPPATKSEKAQVLIEKMEMDGRISELLATMLRVNPRLSC